MKNMLKTMLASKFHQKYSINQESGCWEWTDSLKTNGYGTLRVGAHRIRAHRVSYEIHKGDIPDGMFVCHSCDNRACVNPSHLWLGAPVENTRDMMGKKRNSPQHGSNNPRSKLTDDDVKTIRNRYLTEGVSQVKLAVEFGVHHSTIHKIVHNLRWNSTSVGGS